MRKLKTTDLFAFARMMKAIGIKDEVRDIAQKSDTAAQAWDKGFELLYHAFDLATEKEGEKHVYEFLAGPFETTAEEIADLPLPEFFDKCRELAQENDLPAFFRSAGDLMRPKH